MPDSPGQPSSGNKVAVHLLDPNSGRNLRSWKFKGQVLITIGRSEDQDVEISDPYVSRNHANLEYHDGQWFLISLGRNGVIVSGQAIAEYSVVSEVYFRLGMDGPSLRFLANVEQVEQPLGRGTIVLDTLPAPLFQVDQHKVQSEVGEISSGDYFQTLQQKAKQLRIARQSH